MTNNTTLFDQTNTTINLPHVNFSTIQSRWQIHGDLERFYASFRYIMIILVAGILLANSAVLTAFLRHPNLRTPFNFYLISLLSADIAQSIFDLPFMVMSQFISVWPLGRAACSFSLYAKWVFSAVVRNTHCLISLNRLWALFLPISYRHYHSKTMAACLCVGAWVYVHVFKLPGLLQDALYYRQDGDTCLVNTTAQTKWAMASQFVVDDAAVFLVIISYPIIYWKVRQRARIYPPKINVVAPEQEDGKNRSKLWKAASSTLDLQAEGRVAGESGQLSGQPVPMPPAKKSHSFAVLTYLVIGVTFCWTPVVVYFTISIINDYDNYLYYTVGSLLYYFNALLDPIFFTMAIAPLRAAVYQILSFH